uniref:Uncharacterized protein n=1 Tax=Setaria italica TaxID=4555 RepID=K3YXM3_SETIT
MDYTSEELAKRSGMLTLVTSARTCSLMKEVHVLSPACGDNKHKYQAISTRRSGKI